MLLAKLRQLSALVLAVALTLGTATQGVGATDMSVKMTTLIAADMSMPGDCGACKGNDQGTLAACAALCGGMVAVLPSVAGVISAVATAPSTVAAASVTGRDIPPDPHPPKATILS